MIRAFIAIDLSPEIHLELSKLCQRLQDAGLSPVRWAPVNNIHMTMKFLGDIPEDLVRQISERLQAISAHHSPFEVSIGRLGAFPRLERARVVWVGCDFSARGLQLQSEIETAMQELGIEKEERKFQPHLTIARVSKDVRPAEYTRMADVIRALQIQQLGAVRVGCINLYRSDLLHSGAKYQRLFSTPLSGRMD